MAGATLRFWKMAGAGNDFVVLDARNGLPASPEELARRLCPRRVSVGADGLIAVRRLERGRVEVDFVNADGSPAGFCGNGSRCVARIAKLLGADALPLTIVFPGLVVRALRVADDVEIEAPRPFVVEPRVAFPFEGAGELAGPRISAGVEHVVLREPEAGYDLPRLAAALFVARPDLRGQVNVTLLREAPGTLRVRTFERGVGETLACGSGALAAALTLAPAPDAAADVVLLPPAETPLRVALAGNGGPARLAGEARFVYRGEVDLD